MTYIPVTTVNCILDMTTHGVDNVPYEFLRCGSCVNEGTVITKHGTHAWAKVLRCKGKGCTKSWTVCIECDNVRTRMVRSQQVKRHDTSRHGKKRKAQSLAAPCVPERNRDITAVDEGTADSIDVENNDETNESHPEVNHSSARGEGKEYGISWKGTEQVVEFNFGREESSTYFENEHVGLGAAYLVGKSAFQMEKIAPLLDPKQVRRHMKIAALAAKLTREERDAFSEVLRDVATVQTPRIEDMYGLGIPREPNEMRRQIMEGKHAIIPNLPHPAVVKLNDHAYIPLREILADVLAQGIKIEDISEEAPANGYVGRVGESRRARHILLRGRQINDKGPVRTILIIEWQDDFQHMNSNKAHRSAVWIKVVTIVPPPGIRKQSLRNTYPYAIGLKGTCHEEVERKFKEELAELSKGADDWFYERATKKMVRVHAELFVGIQDQPERRGANFLALGNSTYHARFGHSINFKAAHNVLKACKDCYHRLEHNLPPHDCGVCTKWQWDSVMLDYEPPGNYPTEHIPPTGKLSNFVLDYSKLKGAVNETHSKVSGGSWTATRAKEYMKTFVLNADAQAIIIERALNCYTYNLLDENKESEPAAFGAICREKEKHPDLFAPWGFPEMWNREASLSQLIEAIMHLGFLGITRYLAMMVHRWTAGRGTRASFYRYTAPLLESIADLKLDWCKAQPYTGGKLGGYVSENYVALAKLSKWFYTGLHYLTEDEAYVEPVGLPWTHWIKPHNVGWLNIRGLESTGSAPEVKERVKEYMERPGGPPEVLPPTGGSTELTLSVIQAWSALVSRLMAATMNSSAITEIERAIHIFLSRYAEFDVHVGDGSATPTWIGAYNFMSLLNLPDALREFGPLRPLWEGGVSW